MKMSSERQLTSAPHESRIRRIGNRRNSAEAGRMKKQHVNNRTILHPTIDRQDNRIFSTIKANSTSAADNSCIKLETTNGSRARHSDNANKRVLPEGTRETDMFDSESGLLNSSTNPRRKVSNSISLNVKMKEKIAWSQSKKSFRRNFLPNSAEDMKERLPDAREALGDLLEDLEEDCDNLEEVELIGVLRRVKDAAHSPCVTDIPCTRDTKPYEYETGETRPSNLVTPEYSSDSQSDSEYDTDLEDNFHRKKFERIPTGKNIYESACKEKGIVPASFLLARFTNQEVLMPHHGLGPEGGKALAKALVVNTHIKTLDVSDNDLQSMGGTAFAYMLYENSYITDLDLSENGLDTKAGITIAKAMIVNETVRRLVLRGNQLNDKVAMAFAETLKENQKLCVLNLSYNKLGETGGLYLGAGLSLNYGLTSLNLKWNAITGKGAISIAHALSANETLRSLDLSWNSLGYKGAMALSSNLINNENLKHLDLRNNHFCENSVLKLAPVFAKHKSLVEFKIGQNPIGHEGVNAVFQAVMHNPRIVYVGLEDISVTAEFLPIIKKLEDERNAVIVIDKRTRLTTTEPAKEGMDILMDFLGENSLRLKDMFFRLDKDRSGDISRIEFKQGLKEMGILMDSKQLDKLIKEIDKDENDKIDYSEILGGHRNARLQRRRQTVAKSEKIRMDEAALRLPEMDVIKSSLSLKRL